MTNAITSLHTFCEETDSTKRQQACITVAKQIVAENRLIIVLGAEKRIMDKADKSLAFPPSLDILEFENVCQVPQGVKPESWADTLTALFSDIYGLLEKGECMFKEALLESYKEAGVFDNPENSKAVTMSDLYFYLDRQNDKAHTRLADRLVKYNVFGYRPRNEAINSGKMCDNEVNTLVYVKGNVDKETKAFLYGSLIAAIFAQRMCDKTPNPLEINIIINDAEEVIVDDELYKMIFNLSAAHKLKICCLTGDKRRLPQFVRVNAEEIIIGNPT